MCSSDLAARARLRCHALLHYVVVPLTTAGERSPTCVRLIMGTMRPLGGKLGRFEPNEYYSYGVRPSDVCSFQAGRAVVRGCTRAGPARAVTAHGRRAPRNSLVDCRRIDIERQAAM